MLNILSGKLAELAILLGVLSRAIAAPATYEILPPNTNLADLEGSNSVVVSDIEKTEIGAVIADKAQIQPFYLSDNPTQGQIRSAIAYYARSYEVSQVLALSIAECESQFYIQAHNSSSTAKSLFQFINSTWRQTINQMELPATSSVFDPETHIEAAIWLLAKDGPRHWESSKNCWKPML